MRYIIITFIALPVEIIHSIQMTLRLALQKKKKATNAL